MSEPFQPIAVGSPRDNPLLFRIRCLVDLQLLTIYRFLVEKLSGCKGRLLDVGAGAAPWRGLLGPEVHYRGIDIEAADEFGMTRRTDIDYYDGGRLPYADEVFDHILCVEVLEHVPEPTLFITELKRVLRKGGAMVMTVPWSARVHHMPNDFHRFTRYGLERLLRSCGFTVLSIEERGNDWSVVANKLTVMLVRLLRPNKWSQIIPGCLLAPFLVPLVVLFLLMAHATLPFSSKNSADPLGYGIVARKD